MMKVILRHYTATEPLAHTEETKTNLRDVAQQYQIRYEPLGYTLELEEAKLESEENLDSLNMVTLSCPDRGLGETPFERILECGVTQKDVEYQGKTRLARAVTLHGKDYLALPRGFVAEVLLRALLALVPPEGEGCGGGCQGCRGCS